MNCLMNTVLYPACPSVARSKRERRRVELRRLGTIDIVHSRFYFYSIFMALRRDDEDFVSQEKKELYGEKKAKEMAKEQTLRDEGKQLGSLKLQMMKEQLDHGSYDERADEETKRMRENQDGDDHAEGQMQTLKDETDVVSDVDRQNTVDDILEGQAQQEEEERQRETEQQDEKM